MGFNSQSLIAFHILTESTIISDVLGFCSVDIISYD